MNLQIRQHRNGFTETLHPVHAVLWDHRAGARWSVGPEAGAFWRSSSKPMQLLTALEHADPALLTWIQEEDLAIGAASHSGEPTHIARVRRLLRHLKLKEQDLQCGAHPPMHAASAEKLLRRRLKPTALHNNCSGKHTFMLAACKAQRWPMEYRPLDHPLQVRNRACIEAWCEAHAEVAVDGCGVPTFHMPISAMARAWARLADEMNGTGLAGRIGWAMHRFPHVMSGTGRLDQAVVRAATEPLTVKIGAEGLFCIALPQRRQGITIKVLTGNGDALGVAVKAVLDEVAPGVLPDSVLQDGALPGAVVTNVVGLRVGARVAEWS